MTGLSSTLQNSSFQLEGHKIVDKNGGFKLLVIDRIAAYIAIKQPSAYGFAFAVGSVRAATQPVTTPTGVFVDKAREIMQEYLASGNLTDGEEYTFEYDFDREKFVAMQNPSWWNKSGLGPSQHDPAAAE